MTDALPSWGEWLPLDRKPRHVTAMSTVWRVHRKDDSRRTPWALKTLKFQKGPSSLPFRRFVREIEILKALANQEGIVEVIAHSETESGDAISLYYVMPWAETSLERASKMLRGRLEHVLEIGVKISAALERAHAAGVIHRDVKPANILLYGDEQEPRLADFGIGFLATAERVTRVDGNTVGTDEFVAPELRGGGQSDAVAPTADIYSLGKTLYAVVSGGTVLPREWLDDPRYDLAKVLNDVRLDHMTGLLRRMISERPTDRFQSMADCRAQIERAFINVRAGVQYAPDMYGNRHSPVERFARLQMRLADSTGHHRSDAIQDALRDAKAVADQVADRVDKQPGILTGPVGQKLPKGLAAASEAADALLGVGAALVLNNELDGLDEWLSQLFRWVRTREDAPSVGLRWVLPPAATLAASGAGALAWHRRRFDALRRIVDAQLEAPSSWIHHHILADSAAAVLPWVNEALAGSEVLARADSSLAGYLEKAVNSVAGIVALKGTIAVKDDVLAAAQSQPIVDPVEAYPGFCHPASAQWASDLPIEFSANRTFEREVAQKLFGLEAAELRSECKNLTKPIAAMISTLNRERGMNVRWVPRTFSLAWSQWCGGTP